VKKLISIILIFLSLSSFAQIEGVYKVIIQKQQQKEKSRWTLADWLSTKKTIALQDQWLALHSSSSWFELILDYGMGNVSEKSDGVNTSMDLNRWGAALYMKFLGLEYNNFDFSKLYSSSDYRLNLLLLGSSVQSTHFRIFYGEREYSYDSYSSYKKQGFWGAHFSLYLMNFLGIETQFSKFSKTQSSNNLFSSDGERREFGIFIDIWMLRLYAMKFRERMLYRGSTFKKTVVDGALFGTKLFF